MALSMVGGRKAAANGDSLTAFTGAIIALTMPMVAVGPEIFIVGATTGSDG